MILETEAALARAKQGETETRRNPSKDSPVATACCEKNTEKNLASQLKILRLSRCFLSIRYDSSILYISSLIIFLSYFFVVKIIK